MDLKLSLFLVLIGIFLASCECKGDKYGEILELEVPITTYPMKDTFNVGDTLWIEANFDKEIHLHNSSNTIRIDSFNFFTEFSIAEISDTTENYNVDFDTIVKIGRMEYLPLQTAVVYPIIFVEDVNHYRFKAGIIINTTGLFSMGFSTPSFLYQEPPYDHPVIYKCNRNRRDILEVYYNNPSTTLDAYNKLFLSTKVEYLKELVDFDRYRNGGGITIVVR